MGYLPSEPEEQIDRAALPTTRRYGTRIFLQATIRETLDSLIHSSAQAFSVNCISGPAPAYSVDNLTREDIGSFYQSEDSFGISFESTHK